MAVLDLPEEQRAAITAGLNSANEFEIIAAAELASKLEEAELREVVVYVSDKYWNRIGEAGDRISLAAAKPRNAVPTVELVLPGDSTLKKYIRKCRTEVVGVEVIVGDLKWAAIVDTASYKKDQQSNKTLTARCFGIYEILSYLLIWPNWLLPLQLQVPSKAWFVGPICTVIESMIAEQALRVQSGMWELVNNAFSLNPDWRTWFGRWLTTNGDILTMLTTPIYVVHHNPFFDGSPWVSGVFRMDTIAAAIDKMIKAYGVTVEVELWRPGDPQPDKWSNLKVPTYVVRVTDRSRITGPTSTFLDGLLFQVVNLAGSALGEALYPYIQNPKGQSGVFISPVVGQKYEQPWPVLIDHEHGPMETFEIVDHHPQAYQLIIGGRSPKWAGAPRLTAGGHRPTGLLLTQRPAERVLQLAAGLVDDRHRIDRCPKQSAGRFPQRRRIRVRDAAALPAPRRSGPVHHAHREVPGDRRGPVQRGCHFHVHHHVVGHARIPLRASNFPQRSTVLRRA